MPSETKPRKMSFWMQISGISGAAAVTLGAIGAHAFLKKKPEFIDLIDDKYLEQLYDIVSEVKFTKLLLLLKELNYKFTENFLLFYISNKYSSLSGVGAIYDSGVRISDISILEEYEHELSVLEKRRHILKFILETQGFA